ncbi:MAG: DNA repair protein RecO [Candidatus Nealsonbacteria bacterium]|nr:DNA repair protein RecO [Candidatus Nealsonbacteria bacterium]
MATRYRTQCLIVKKDDKGESDQIFSVYTKDFGRLNILGKAIRKNASKLRGGADLFYFSDIEFIQGKAQKILTEATVIDSCLNIRKDLRRMTVAYQITDILDGMIPKEERDEQIWHLINEIFYKLDIWQIGKLEILYYYFFWNLAAILGYQPALTHNSLGGEQIDGDLAKILKLLFQKDWPILAKLKIEPNHIELLKNTSEWYNKNTITANYEK